MTVILKHTPTGLGTRLSLQQLEQLACGDAKLTMHYTAGYDIPRSMKLTASERAAYEAAKRDGYFRTKPERVLVLAHYWHETMGRPSIKVTVAKRTATIEMDLISAPLAPSDRWRDHPDLEQHMRKLADAYGARVKWAGHFNLIRAVPIENADACAAGLRALYDELTNQTAENAHYTSL
jgi:hypothetical protein